MADIKALFQNAVLDTVVPEATEAKLPEALEDTTEDASEADSAESTSLISIKQRTRLFFGTLNLLILKWSSLTHSQAHR